ncbi:hypothetical protein NADFUDRAFT_46863, partial [Nadsonia fulvescens var. elongata DSM 6958]
MSDSLDLLASQALAKTKSEFGFSTNETVTSSIVNESVNSNQETFEDTGISTIISEKIISEETKFQRDYYSDSASDYDGTVARKKTKSSRVRISIKDNMVYEAVDGTSGLRQNFISSGKDEDSETAIHPFLKSQSRSASPNAERESNWAEHDDNGREEEDNDYND